MQLIGFISVLMLCMTSISIFNGWTLTVLWSWFVVDTFEVQELGIATAIGFCLIIKFLTVTKESNDDSKDPTEKLFKGLAFNVSKSLISLCIGWVAVQFI